MHKIPVAKPEQARNVVVARDDLFAGAGMKLLRSAPGPTVIKILHI